MGVGCVWVVALTGAAVALSLQAVARSRLDGFVALVNASSATPLAAGEGFGWPDAATASAWTGVPRAMLEVSDADAALYDLHPVERELVGTVFALLCRRDVAVFREIAKGAHVVVPGDEGRYYTWIRHMQAAYQRSSSHYSRVPQYGVPEGHLLKTLLSGEDRFRASWFQLEGAEWAPMHNFGDSLIHAVNYVQYQLTDRQVGPLGTSAHTDENPLVLVPGAGVVGGW